MHKPDDGASKPSAWGARSQGAMLVGLVASTAFLAGGCSSTLVVTRPSSATAAVGIIQASAGRDVQLGYVSSHQPQSTPEFKQGKLSLVEGDSFLVSEGNGRNFRVPFGYTRSITWKDRGLGTIEGLLIGAIPGIILGVLSARVISSTCSSECESGNCYCQNDKNITGGFLGGVITGTIGAAIGAAIGHSTTYTF